MLSSESGSISKVQTLFFKRNLFMVLGALSFILTGCDDKQAAQTLDKSKAESQSQGKIYKVAVTSTTPPFAFMDEKGTSIGMDIDILNEIAKVEGFKVQYYSTSWDGMFESIDKKDADIAISGISYKDERKAKYGLSNSYYFNPSAMVYLTDKNNYQTIADLTGKKVAGRLSANGKSFLYAKKISGDQAVFDKTPYLIFRAVIKENADAAIYDQPVLRYIAKKFPQYKVNVVPLEKEDDPTTQTVIVTSKSNPELLNKINEGIQKLQQQNKLAEIEKKWIN